MYVPKETFFVLRIENKCIVVRVFFTFVCYTGHIYATTDFFSVPEKGSCFLKDQRTSFPNGEATEQPAAAVSKT